MSQVKKQSKLNKFFHYWFDDVKLSSCVITILSSGFLAFGLYNVHSISKVTEGGVLGLILLLEHWLNISPAISGFVLNLACYILGAKILGKMFIIYSIISTVSFSAFYGIFEQFPPVYPEIAEMPLVASVVGALFVGIGAGFCVKVGAATGGDDALAMSLAKITKIDIQWIYLFTDFVVLVLSLSYIPFRRIIYSFITVILSGQIVGLIQKIDTKSKEKKEKKKTKIQREVEDKAE